MSLPLPPTLHFPTLSRLLVSFLREETTRVGYQKAVVGLSGGIDSAVVAALMVQAFGSENCLGVMLPYRGSSPASEADARLVADAIHLPVTRIEITPMADGYISDEMSALRKGNLFARLRMAVLFDIAMREQALVIGTSNKTEILLGYSTWFGDGAWSLGPIGDLYKCQIVALAKQLNLPPVIWEKPPTADLWDGQTDENELGFSYDDADRYLYHRVDLRLSMDELIQSGFPAAIAKSIERRIATSHYKRVSPPIAKIQNRSVGTDFLYARDAGS
ncbi:MAG: NAD+ synthase [bacterium]|nr:NAD+ synthase [bacterium]